jgi:hypothetical protein
MPAQRFEVIIRSEDLSGHFSYTAMRGQLCKLILVDNPFTKVFLLLRTQSLKTLSSSSVVCSTVDPTLQDRSGDCKRACNSS